jgi:hypothetical protein
MNDLSVYRQGFCSVKSRRGGGGGVPGRDLNPRLSLLQQQQLSLTLFGYRTGRY